MIPPGRHRLPQSFILAHQRQRLIDAAAEVAAERGLARMRVSDVVRAAGVARNTFYEHFHNGAECAASAVNHGFIEALAAVEEAAAPAEGRAGRIRAGIHGLIAWLMENPNYARLCVVESHCLAGCDAAQREGLAAFADALETTVGGGVERTTCDLVVGGVFSILYKHVLTDPQLLGGLQDQIADFALAPFEEVVV